MRLLLFLLLNASVVITTGKGKKISDNRSTDINFLYLFLLKLLWRLLCLESLPCRVKSIKWANSTSRVIMETTATDHKHDTVSSLDQIELAIV